MNPFASTDLIRYRMIRYRTRIGGMAALVMLGLTSGCLSFGGRDADEPSSVTPTRTQLLFLNPAESSGWVGYTNSGHSSVVTEDYRVLVIRQQSGEILYDSIVPLPGTLEAHGFEMEPGDPRLQRLARSVDQEIIAPMEAYRRRSASDQPEPQAPAPVATPAAPPAATPAPAPQPTPRLDVKPAPTPKAMTDEVPALVDGPNSSLTGITVLSSTDSTLTLDIEPADMLRKGDRLYLRHPPKVITLPGMDETIMTSGEVSGLIEVTRIEGGTAITTLLSGSIPEQMYFERAENP